MLFYQGHALIHQSHHDIISHESSSSERPPVSHIHLVEKHRQNMKGVARIQLRLTLWSLDKKGLYILRLEHVLVRFSIQYRSYRH